MRTGVKSLACAILIAFCVVLGASIESMAAGLTIAQQPEDVTACSGERVSFSVSAEGTGLTYQWQYLASGTTSWKVFANDTTNTLSRNVPATWDGWKFRCVIKDSSNNTVTTKEVELTILEKVAIVSQPSSVTVTAATVRVLVSEAEVKVRVEVGSVVIERAGLIVSVASSDVTLLLLLS